MVKRILMTALAVVAIGLAGYAAQKEHVIDRGETLESIAKKYGVTTQALKEANPSVETMFYTGMVLVIPEGGAPQTALAETSNGVEQISETGTAVVTSNIEKEDEIYPVNAVGFHIGVDINSISDFKHLADEAAFSNGFSMDFQIDYRRYLYNGLFAGVSAGYSHTSYSLTSKQKNGEYLLGYKKSETTVHGIPLDLNVGYDFRLPSNPLLGLTVYTGLHGNLNVKTNYKVDGKKVDLDKQYQEALDSWEEAKDLADEWDFDFDMEKPEKIGKTKMNFGWNVGGEFRISDFVLGVKYIIPFDKNSLMKDYGMSNKDKDSSAYKFKMNSLQIYIGWTLPF